MRFKTWNEAHTHAQRKANTLGLSMGIEKTKEFGKLGFNVRIIPKPKNRYGKDYLCEAVEPERRIL